MVVIKEGKLNKKMAWFTTCNTCGSDLKIIQGDPHATKEVGYQCDRGQYFIRYICPVCKGKKIAYTKYWGMEGNAIYKEIVLEEKDYEDIDSWNEKEELTEEEIKHISNRYAP